MASRTEKTAATATSRRLSLRVLIFLLCSGLVFLMVLASVGFSILQGRNVGDTAVNEALARSQATQQYFERLRLRQLELITELVAGDADLRSYFGEALGGGDDLFGEADSEPVDIQSITDLMDERRQDIGFDVAMLLDPDGMLLAHTARPVGEEEYFDDHPAVAQLMADLYSVTGLWEEGGELFQAAMVPLEEGDSLIGFFIAGLRVDASLIDEVKTATGTELILYSRQGPYASTLPAVDTDDLMRQLNVDAALFDEVLSGLSPDLTREVTIGGRPWVTGFRPFDRNSDVPVVAVSMISLDAVLTGYRTLQRAMLLVGGVMILVGLLAALLLARRVTLPIKRLAKVATDARRGNYEQHFDVSGGDEISELSRAFDSLLSDLRERRDMEDFVTDLSRYLPEPGMEEAQARTELTMEIRPEHKQVALLGLDFRGVAADSGDARSHIKALETRLQRVEGCVNRCGGRIEALMGQRALLGFDGEHASLEAMACAGELARSESDLPPMALVSGEADRGSVRTAGLRTGVVLGKPSQQLDLLLEEARPGQLLLSPSVKTALEEALEEPRPTVVAGRVSGRKYYSLTAEALTELPGPDDSGADEAPAAAPGVIEIGDVFADRYEVIAELGSGGMGKVYKALDRDLQDFVALKTLHEEIAQDQRYLDSLKEEIKLARKITHPNVLRTFDFGQHDGTAYISMEYVRGMTLRYLLHQRPQLPYSAGLRIARQLCDSLAAAHDQDVIHRDIKPENLILESAGNVKLMDFGIAQPRAKLAMEQAQDVFVGTPRYAAPEQMEGKPVDARADIFACGVMLYEIFTGVAPFGGSDVVEIYKAKANEALPAPSDVWRDIPPELERVILGCLAADPDRRFADAKQLVQALSGLRA